MSGLFLFVWVPLTLFGALWLGMNVSPGAGLAALLWAALSMPVILGVAWWDVRSDGYELEKVWDERLGRRRWRVGTRTRAGEVRWCQPGEVQQ